MVTASLLLPGAALATWTPAMTIPASRDASSPAVAVNARGDIAVAWAVEGHVGTGRHRHVTVLVRAAVRRAGAARFSSHTLLSARDRAAQGVAVAINSRGETTVAWIDEPDANGLLHGPKTVRAAYRTVGSRWSRTQAIGRSSAFFYAYPRLAAAPNGTAVLTYNAGVAAAPGVAAAWRSPGRPFGAPRAVTSGRGYLSEPTLAVDRVGRIFLSGTRGCDSASSSGVVFTATSRSRRFGAPKIVAPAPATKMRLVVTADGSAIVSWLAQECSTTEDLTGAPMTAALNAGRVTAPVRLDDKSALDMVLTGSRSGAQVSWTAFPGNTPTPIELTAAVSRDGTAQPAQAPAGGWVAVAADGEGDQLVRLFQLPFTATADSIAVQPAGGGALEPGPVALSGTPPAAGAVAASDGSALAVLSHTSPRLVAAVWRPAGR